MLKLSADDASRVGVALHGVSVGNRPVHSHLSAFHLIFAGTLSSAICCRARVLTVSVSLEALRRRGAAPQQVPKVATTATGLRPLVGVSRGCSCSEVALP